LFTEVHIESNSAKFPEFASSKCWIAHISG
jgi:hypothetical protein